ncbi:MAG: Mov34/MPN/PAD-1 family protein [Gemmatimonadaceae bacterium]
MITLPAAALERIREHAQDAYPRECCGALIGRVSHNHGASKEVVRAVALANATPEMSERRYLIPGDTVLEIGRAAEHDGLEVVGFYHSHPDHRPEPSRLDCEEAWPWYTYLIIGSRSDSAGPARAWQLEDDGLQFAEEELTIVGEDT